MNCVVVVGGTQEGGRVSLYGLTPAEVGIENALNVLVARELKSDHPVLMYENCSHGLSLNQVIKTVLLTGIMDERFAERLATAHASQQVVRVMIPLCIWRNGVTAHDLNRMIDVGGLAGKVTLELASLGTGSLVSTR